MAIVITAVVVVVSSSPSCFEVVIVRGINVHCYDDESKKLLLKTKIRES